MVASFEFATHTELAAGLRRLIEELEKRVGLRAPIKMFIAGGMAVHLYTAARVTTDVDAEFSKRILLPSDLVVETEGGNMLYLDPSYNSTFALMHEDYLDDAVPVPIGTQFVHAYVLSPLAALAGYVGNTDYLRMNLRDVLKFAARIT